MRLVMLVCVLIAACEDVDEALGTVDHEFLAVRLAAVQPTNPEDGVIVDVELRVANRDRLVSIAVSDGTLQVVGGPPGETAFCARARQAGSWIVPIVVVPTDDEALLQARLLFGTDSAKCEGELGDSLVVPISKPRLTTPADGATNAR